VDPQIRNIFYILAAVLFIFGIKGLTHPRTAVRGNLLGALGMFVAIVVTLIDQQMIGWGWIIAGVVLGGVIGAAAAIMIQMTGMPQLVALYNGFGGIASVFVAGAVFNEYVFKAGQMAEQLGREVGVIEAIANPLVGAAANPMQVIIATIASGIIGAVTFSGSVIAWAKLQEVIPGQPYMTPLLKVGSALTGALTLLLAVFLYMWPDAAILYVLLVVVALVLGVFLVIPIGGADMPVVIALLNSYSGLAAAATGFVINNTVLIVAGSLVGASGLILTKIMCVAMNRSLTNVLFGFMAVAEAGPSADEIYAGKVKAASPEEVSMLFDGARRVVIVPGYGMAAAQAQHVISDLADLLTTRGIEVEYGVHPVAGRMPGHMNVLLAEADVPYDQLKEMDEVNSTIEQADVALVIGANDTVNPSARTDPESPIAGMPIVDVDKARTVVVVKRSLSPGFAGIPNPLFAGDNTLMMFGDGKKAIVELIGHIKEAA
jgi:NAD(P) transhydrogenase subunit beta